MGVLAVLYALQLGRRPVMRGAGRSRAVRVVVDEKGLLETIEGVESFAPWASVVSYRVWEERVFVRLKSEMLATVPRCSLQEGSSSVDDLIALLRERGVPEVPARPIS